MPLDCIPGYREAVAQETAARDAAFLDVTETVCGVELRPLTPLDTLRLEAAGNAFMTGATVGPEDVAQLLWHQSPEFDPRPKPRRRFLRRLADLAVDLPEIAHAIANYIAVAFADAPASKPETEQAIQYASYAAALVDVFAREYGWSEDEILRIPYRRLWQYVRRIARHYDPKAILINPSDKIKGDWLASIQTAQAAQ